MILLNLKTNIKQTRKKILTLQKYKQLIILLKKVNNGDYMEKVCFV